MVAVLRVLFFDLGFVFFSIYLLLFRCYSVLTLTYD